MSPSADDRRHAPAAERNREPIAAVLRRVLPSQGTVLEIASGTGQHVCHFARSFPQLTWQPSEPQPEMRRSIEAWRQHEGLTNVRAPLDLDVTATRWPVQQADAIVNINMIHIAPWEATEALLRGAGELLPPNAPLVTYGPYRIGGRHTAPSNDAFDRGLRERDPRWGVRDLDEVCTLAREHALRFERRESMPANNFTVVFRRIPD